MSNVLNEKIRQSFRNIESFKRKNARIFYQLQSLLPEDILEDFKEHANEFYNKFNQIQKLEHQDRLQTLLQQNPIKSINFGEGKWLRNLTTTVIPEEIRPILALGDKFCPPVQLSKKNLVEVISKIEASIESKAQLVKLDVRNRVTNVLTNKLSQPTRELREHKKLRCLISKTNQFLKENPQLVVVKADKSNCTVVAEKDLYIDKIKVLLSDNSTYEKVTPRYRKGVVINETLCVQRKFNTYISELQLKGFINQHEGIKLRKYNSAPAKLYGLFKMHKENNPIRPIVAYCGSPGENLAVEFNKILTPVVGRASSFVKNALDFKQKLSNIHIPPGHKLFSLDVVSLFTNIPKDMLFNIIEQKWKEISEHTQIPIDLFKQGLSLLFDNCYFSFDDTTYRQKYGLPMGCPCSPVLANLVMEFLEQKILHRLKVEFNVNILVYYRYVDDIFIIAREEEISLIVRIFNENESERLRFTYEAEEGNCLPFLDVNVHRNNEGILTFDWYHKSTWSERYLNFNSHLPLRYKRNTIHMLTRKVLELSDEKYQKQNFQLIEDVLVRNA